MSLVQVEAINSYEVLTLNRGKANPLNIDLCQALLDELERAKNNPKVRGVILTGNTLGYFSVGLDLKELYYYDEAKITEFWSVWEKMLTSLLKFNKPLIGAINGYSPAGGCVIAVSCDYRVMADDPKFVIGLNETSVGIVVPEYIFHLYKYWIGEKAAFKYLMDGALHSPQKAEEIGLVDEICEMSEVLDRSKFQMEKWLLKPDNIIQKTKMNLKAQMIADIENVEPVSDKEKLKSWFDPKSREVMGMIVAQLSK